MVSRIDRARLASKVRLVSQHVFRLFVELFRVPVDRLEVLVVSGPTLSNREALPQQSLDGLGAASAYLCQLVDRLDQVLR
jgi:hypothetical protein